MIVRMFHSAVDPQDIERGKRLFRDRVRPAFETFDGCLGIELHIGVDEHTSDWVDVTAISRWASREVMDRAVESLEYEQAAAEFVKLFRETPIIKHYEVVE